MNPIAAVMINLALLFYSIGVWSERLQGRLKVWHTVFFWFGLVCDTWGTGMMFEYVGGMSYDIHGFSGVLAIVLMFVHAIWATYVLIRKDDRMIVSFHKFSIFVWLVWLVPYFSPMAFRILEAGK
ncbi:MAG: TIGR03987 family protein [Anaerolineales bacterium]|nr:TIGR03987 family protein [Anaerolineales bacterium]